MKMFKKYGRMALILMLVVIIALLPCLNAYAFAITASSTAVMALLALSGVTLMSANIPDSVAQNMYRDITTIATNTSHALYESANNILDFTADYSRKVATATGEMIEVSGINLSNAIGSFKNYLTYKNVNGAYSGVVVDNYSNALNISQMLAFNTAVSGSQSFSNDEFSATAFMSAYQSFVNQVDISNTILVSTRNYYDMSVSGFLENYNDAYLLRSYSNDKWDTLTDFQNSVQSVYHLLTSTFSNYVTGITFDGFKIKNHFNDDIDCTLEMLFLALSDGVFYGWFALDDNNNVITASGGRIEYAFDMADASMSAIPFTFYAYDTGKIGYIASNSTGYMGIFANPQVMNDLPRYSSETNRSNSDLVPYYDTGTVSFTSSAVAVPNVYGDAIGQDVYGVPDIPESVISGQYNPDVADRIGAVVGGADVIGLNVPVDTGADVYNPSIDALIGSGTLTSDVVIDGTTIATGTDVITGVQTAVGDIATTTDTVLDTSTDIPDVPNNPGTPTFPDVFPGLWDWVNNLVDNALQWFIFCGDVFSALPGAIKYTFLGGMTTVLAVGVIKKLLF